MTDWGGVQIAVTPRLIIRTFTEHDLPVYAALNADPEVYRWLSGQPLSREDSDDTAAWAQELFATEGIGLLAVERQEDGEFLGMCGLHHQESYPDEVEVAWRLARESTGVAVTPLRRPSPGWSWDSVGSGWRGQSPAPGRTTIGVWPSCADSG